MSDRPRFLIVDGHSVIFAWPELRAMHARRTAQARDLLVKRLTGYQDYSGVRVVAVFDGKGDSLSEETIPGGIQIFYSPLGCTADTVIERLVALYSSKCEITVATSDRMEQQTIHTLGADWVSSDQLLPLIESAEKDLGRVLTEQRKQKQVF